MFLRRRQLGGAPPGEPPAQAKLMIVSRAATPCLAIKRHGPLVRLARHCPKGCRPYVSVAPKARRIDGKSGGTTCRAWDGEPAGTRTQGPRLKRAMLYRLSYRLTERRARILPPTLSLCLDHPSRDLRDLREKRNRSEMSSLRVPPVADVLLVSLTIHERRERILSGLRRVMVSLRFEPVEIISMGHSERSSRYWR